MTEFRPSSTFRVIPSSERAALLASTPLFSALDADALHEVVRQVESVNMIGGELLMREGEVGDCMYIVANGRLAVVVDTAEGREQRVAEIGRGETVGEMALLSGSPRSATVRTVRDSVLLRFSKASFDDMLERHPRMTMQLARMIVHRLERSIHGKPAGLSAPSTIAVAPAGRDAPMAFVAKLLADGLARLGPTLHLTSARIDRMLSTAIVGHGEITLDAAVVAWLDEQEAAHDFVIYECDGAPTAWTARCLRQADRIVLAGHAAADASLTEIETQLFADTSTRPASWAELVLVHSSDTRIPSRAEVWRKNRNVVAHHHIRDGSVADADRLVRLLFGRGVGVVLSGGAARGFAHLGVLRALEECAVDIDVIGGTSMGAIMGGLLACGYAHAERMERAKFAFSKHPPNKDFTLPLVALLHGGRSNRMMRSMYGDTLIENLWTPFFCVSTNLTRAEPRVTREGPLWRWVRASCSPPGLAPPIFDDGQMFADGGILENLPVGTMRRSPGVAVTIASDAGAVAETKRNLPEWDGVSGWRVLRDRLVGGSNGADGRALPTLSEILMLTSTINSVPAGLEARRLADLYLNPPAPGVKLTQWNAIDQLAESAYRYAMERIGEWQR